MKAFVELSKSATIAILSVLLLAALTQTAIRAQSLDGIDDPECTFITDSRIGSGDCHAEILETAMWCGPGDFEVIDSTVYMVMGYGLQVMTFRDLALERKGRRYFMPDLYQVEATPSLLFTAALNCLTCYPRHGRRLLHKAFDEIEVEGNIIKLEVLDHYAYLLTHTELTVVDFADPRQLIKVSQIPLPISTVRNPDMEVTPDGVYIAAFYLYAVTDIFSESPVITRLDKFWTARSVSAWGDSLWVLKTADWQPTSECTYECYDITDPSSPTLVSREHSWGDPTSILVRQDSLIVAGGESGVGIFDVSDPETLLPIGCLDPFGAATGVQEESGLLFVRNSMPYAELFTLYNRSLCLANGGDSSTVTSVSGVDTCDFAVYDMTSEDEPILVGRYEHPGYSREILREENTVWVRGMVGNIRTLTLGKNGRIIEGPLLKAAGEPSSFCVHDGLLIAGSDFREGVQIYDVSDPMQPKLLSTIPTILALRSLLLAGHTAYRVGLSGPPYAFDISDPTAPQEIGPVDIPGLRAPAAYRDTLLFCLSGGYEISVFSLSDPDTLRLVSTFSLEGSYYRLWNLTIKDNLLLTTDHNTVFLVDVSSLADPKVLSTLVVPGAEEMSWSKDRLYILSEREVKIFDIADRTAPHKLGIYDTPGGPWDLEVFGDDLLIADWSGFLRIRPDMITEVEEDDPPKEQLPSNSSLHGSYPNPFNSSTVISYSLDQRMHVRLTVVNTLGQTVAVLLDREHPAGDFTASWNGRDDRDREVATGVYFARLETEDAVESIKMVLLK